MGWKVLFFFKKEMLNDRIRMLENICRYRVQDTNHTMPFRRKSRIMPSFGRSRMWHNIEAGGNSRVYLLMGDERIPVW